MKADRRDPGVRAQGRSRTRIAAVLVMGCAISACARSVAPDATGDPGMVRVPAGFFEMGSADGPGNERPVHKVYLGAFWIDRTEVTARDYRGCVEAEKCAKPETGRWWNNNWEEPGEEVPFLRLFWGRAKRDDHPINYVDWSQARAFCEWMGKRLPTEAEWEKAARGTDGRTYPWGEELPSCERAVIADGGAGCGEGATWPVGSKPLGASPYGALDMIGSVMEWVEDWYDPGSYAEAAGTDPRGPPTGTHRVARGGSWAIAEDAWDLRASNREGLDPALRHYAVGFRCARSEEPGRDPPRESKLSS